MKKLSFILVALFTLGFIQAQNTATVTVNGDNNAGYVNQLGQNNQATINQATAYSLCDYNTGTIYQTGQNNQAMIDQSGAGISGCNVNAGYVNQLGQNNQATIEQTGYKNQADISDNRPSTLYPLLTDTKGITQVGDNNVGTIIQYNLNMMGTPGPTGGMNQSGDNNSAYINQSRSSLHEFDVAWVKQEGDWNKSIQNQNVANAESHIWQQSSSFGKGTQASRLQTIQVGNTAETQQSTFGYYTSFANIIQVGDLNNAYINQKNGRNLAETTQRGDNNKSIQVQSEGDIAKTEQLSDRNTANYYQDGYNKVTSLQNLGDGNVANLTQNGRSQADIVQTGSINVLKGLDTDIMATSLDGSKLDLDQIGIGNTLSMQQAWGGVATVSQVGAGNACIVIQN